METDQRVLVIDDDESFREVMEMELSDRGFRPDCVATAEEVRSMLQDTFYPVVLLDLNLENQDGAEFVPEIQSLSPGTAIVVLTGHATVESAVELLKSGIYDYKTKPCPLDELESTLDRAVENVNLRRDNRALREVLSERNESTRMVGQSKSTQTIRDKIQEVAQQDVPVLITGESGTGKEVAARMIHDQSPRHEAPFVPVDPGSIPSKLFEAELFGHKKGAFTGAESDREGLIASADQGTLFFDEVGEIPLDLQPKLLRFLETREYRRVGESQTRQVDVRVVSATNRPLGDMAREGTFREDLYYRLNVFPIEIPPLRQRIDDLDQLVPHLIEESDVVTGSSIEVNAEALELMKQYRWPGNVRELRNVIDRLLITGDATITRSVVASILPDDFSNEGREVKPLHEVEAEYIQRALDRLDGDKQLAAEKLDVSLKTLYNKIDQYDLSLPE